MTLSPFIRCNHSVTEGYKTIPNSIKVVLNKDNKIYTHEYKGIKFFVCRNVANCSRDWRATEVLSGSILQMNVYTTYRTMKECISATYNMIDIVGHDRLNELANYVIENYPFDAVMTQPEYEEWSIAEASK